MWFRIAKLFMMLAVISAAAGCTRQAPSPAPVVSGERPNPMKSRAAALAVKLATANRAAKLDVHGNYVVMADETLYGISRRTGADLRDLISTNNLKPPYRLTHGQHLQIPAVRYHRVTSGQTLYAISRQYRVSPYALARDNQISPPYKIWPGQRLRLPASERSSTEKDNSATRSIKQPVVIPAAGALPTPRQKPKAVKPVLKLQPTRAGRRFAWPVQGRVISRFGVKPNGLHNDGINIAVKAGTAVRAADNGVVVYAGNELRGFGNLLLLRHEGGWVTAYGHNQTLIVKVGDLVRRGQQIARGGSTGNISRPQLHFEIRKGRRAVNPARHLS